MLTISSTEDNPVPIDCGLDFKLYRRNPSSTFASVLPEDLKLIQNDGVTITGYTGDYLVVDLINGGFRCIPRKQFEATYSCIESANALDKENT